MGKETNNKSRRQKTKAQGRERGGVPYKHLVADRFCQTKVMRLVSSCLVFVLPTFGSFVWCRVEPKVGLWIYPSHGISFSHRVNHNHIIYVFILLACLVLACVVFAYVVVVLPLPVVFV